MSKIKYCISMIVKFVLKNYFLRVYNVKYKFINFNPKQDGPFFLIGNHVLLMDAFLCNFVLKGYAVPVANAFVYTDFKKRVGMTKMIDSIIKRKGQSDIQTIRNIKRVMKQGRAVAVYPEGNTSYYGCTEDSMYATAKLIKMQKVDVVVAKTMGGFFARPRWRKSRAHKPYLEIEMSKLLTGDQIQNLTVDEIFTIMIKSYEHNDYEWNRKRQIKYFGNDRLLGAHRVIYGCPTCESINKLNTKGDQISCENCGTTGVINDYGFIEGAKYDNLVEWGRYQEDLLKTKLDDSYTVKVTFYKIDWDKHKKIFISDRAVIKIESKEMFIEYDNKTITIDISNIKGEAYTESNEFSFDYESETYFFTTESPKFLLDLVTFIKED